MLKATKHLFKLAIGFWTLGRTGAGLPSVLVDTLPLPLRLLLPNKRRASKKNPAPLAKAFSKLGPTYIKLGQFLAVRTDILDPDYIQDLSQLHDKLPPFPQAVAEKIIITAFGKNPFASFSAPVAAASIAQVHKALDESGKPYAVKILRPNIQKRFESDMADLLWAGKKLERHLPAAKRLRPLAALENLQATTLREMDFRLEAAAMAEIKQKSHKLKNIYIPKPEWRWTRESILTMEWVEGVPLSNLAQVAAAGHNLKSLSKTLLQGFLTQALYDGVFHADLHPGNLFVRSDGTLVPVDFGIVGHLPARDRRAMAWILRAFIQGDYDSAAKWHIWSGYVPPHTSPSLFSSALRAIGEPILDKAAADISMADLLWQLFETAGKFEMETQPQLLLLQKTMVTAEGLARQLDPQMNIWHHATPVIEGWIRREYAPDRLAAQGVETALKLWHLLPELMKKPPPAPPPVVPRKKKWLALLALLFAVLSALAGAFLTKIYPLDIFFM